MQRQRGGTFLGFVLGLVIGLGIAFGIALYVTKVPRPAAPTKTILKPKRTRTGIPMP